jgi:hypothetical protein
MNERWEMGDGSIDSLGGLGPKMDERGNKGRGSFRLRRRLAVAAAAALVAISKFQKMTRRSRRYLQ